MTVEACYYIHPTKTDTMTTASPIPSTPPAAPAAITWNCQPPKGGSWFEHKMGLPDEITRIFVEGFKTTAPTDKRIEADPYAMSVLLALPQFDWVDHHSTSGYPANQRGVLRTHSKSTDFRPVDFAVHLNSGLPKHTIRLVCGNRFIDISLINVP
jgi:hypothetical protein